MFPGFFVLLQASFSPEKCQLRQMLKLSVLAGDEAGLSISACFFLKVASTSDYLRDNCL
jgi:hypothetical protein